MTGSGDNILGVSYATASVEAVAAFAAAHYDLGDGLLSCALLNRGFNDTYVLRTSVGESFVLRLSGHRTRGPADVAAETAFLAYLDAEGVPVAAAMPTRSGALFTSARLPDGPRAVVLFRHAEGRRPELDAPEDARSQGVTLAQLHCAAERYPARMAGRYKLDLDHLLHRQVAAVMALQFDAPQARGDLKALATRLADAVGCLDPSLTRTLCQCRRSSARSRQPTIRAGSGISGVSWRWTLIRSVCPLGASASAIADCHDLHDRTLGVADQSHPAFIGCPQGLRGRHGTGLRSRCGLRAGGKIL